VSRISEAGELLSKLSSRVRRRRRVDARYRRGLPLQQLRYVSGAPPTPLEHLLRNKGGEGNEQGRWQLAPEVVTPASIEDAAHNEPKNKNPR
jgi:hypothetical protein